MTRLTAARRRLHLLALALVLGHLPAYAGAAPDAYPAKPIRLIVPFTPRGTSDVIARILADQLGAKLGQTVVVDNRPGAGGTIGSDIAAKAAPDGYTLLYSAKSLAINASLYRSLPYDALRDFAPVTLVQETPYLFVASDKLPVTTMKEFIGYVRSRPGKVNYASGGTGTGPQMAMELLKLELGLDLVHVPYKGSAPALRDVVAGYVQAQCASLIAAVQYLGTGRLRALAVSSARRSPLLPDVPTMIESGIPGYDENGWSGIVAPAHTPHAAIARLNREINALIERPDIVDHMAKEGSRPAGSTPQAYAELLKREVAKWAEVVRRTGMHAN
jgi:tripartite-type tricarboxylate transporter receptor subunit TctC